MAIGPIDYTSAFGQQGGPFGQVLQGLQAGSQFAAIEQQRAAQQAAIEAQRQKTAAEEAAMRRQQQINDAVAGLVANPNRTFSDYERVAILLPEKEAASLRANFEGLSKERQASDLAFSGQVLAAFNSKAPQVGVSLLRERAAGERNAGREQQARAFETWADIAERDPESASATIGTLVSVLPGGDKVIESVGKVQGQRREAALFPATMKKAEAEANTAAVAAKFAESKAVSELALRDAQIRGLAVDEQIKRQNVAIAAMNARTAAEGNAIKRQELQQRLREMEDKRDSLVREKTAELESARGNIDNMLNTADRVLNTPMSVVGAAAGPVSARLPTAFQSTADFEALVETLGSQAFLAQIPNIKGMGQLSNAEGDKLQAALQNFSLKQSPEQLMRNVREAQRLLLKARRNIEGRYGAQPSVPDTPAATTAAPRPGAATPQTVDDLVRRYGGGG